MQTQPASTLIFPFGCNASQQKAVQAAFENQISVVTRTSGNWKDPNDSEHHCQISLCVGKDCSGGILIITPPLSMYLRSYPKYDMGFIVALLGSTANKRENSSRLQEEEKTISGEL